MRRGGHEGLLCKVLGTSTNYGSPFRCFNSHRCCPSPYVADSLNKRSWWPRAKMPSLLKLLRLLLLLLCRNTGCNYCYRRDRRIGCCFSYCRCRCGHGLLLLLLMLILPRFLVLVHNIVWLRPTASPAVGLDILL